MSRAAIVGFCLVVAGASGCTAPQVIRQDAGSVVVAIPENTNTWPGYYQDEAKSEAAKYIQDPMLVNTTRVKVGEQTTNTSDVTRRDIGGRNDKPKVGEEVTASNTTSVADKYEYHLEFQSRTIPNRGPGMTTFPPPTPGGSPMSPMGESRMPPRPADDARISRPDQNPLPRTGFSGSVEGLQMRQN